MLGVFLLVLGIVVVFPVALFFLVRWIAFRFVKTQRDAAGLRAITPSGFLFYTCLVLVLFTLFTVRQFHLGGSVGDFLNRPMGYVAALLLLVIVSMGGEVLLRKLGVLTTRDRSRRDV